LRNNIFVANFMNACYIENQSLILHLSSAR
jgi:hypothetical protein